jgi:CDP-diacylglycerol pyrophosphatase
MKETASSAENSSHTRLQDISTLHISTRSLGTEQQLRPLSQYLAKRCMKLLAQSKEKKTLATSE